jgi:hypothetical protein
MFEVEDQIKPICLKHYKDTTITREVLHNIAIDIEKNFNVDVIDYPYGCESIIYSKNMTLEKAQKTGYNYTLNYNFNLLKQDATVGYHLGDLILARTNVEDYVYIIPFEYPWIDIRSGGKEFKVNDFEHLFILLTCGYEDLFEIYDFVGINSSNGRIVPYPNRHIDFYVCSNFTIPKSSENYLVKGEFLYLMRDLYERGIESKDIINLARNMGSRIENISKGEINPIVTEMYEEFIRKENLV